MKDKAMMLIILTIVFIGWGGYKVAKATYITLAWEKTEGIVTAFPRHVWRCGKNRSECYTLNVRFEVDKKSYTVESDKIYPKPPKELIDENVTVYYSTTKPQRAALGGEYGPMEGGVIILFVGFIMFFVWVFVKPKK